jgi:putative ABC transport system permease protein
MDILWQDLRYGFRMLRNKPGFSLVAVLALALGIGANTAIFSVVNALMLRALPFPDPDRLITIWEDHRARGGPEKEWTTPANLRDWQEQSRSFEQLAAYVGWGPTLTGNMEPEMLDGASISHNMFALLGVEPVAGRSFNAEEDQPGGEKVVVLSHGLWQRGFGADRSILGNKVSLSGEACTVIGIMPAGFKPPFAAEAEIWRPLRQALNPNCQRACIVLRALGRLKKGVSATQAEAELNTIARRLETEFPVAYRGIGIRIVPLHKQMVGDTRPALLALTGAVGFVLLIACANVANLLLARAASREKEIATRTAIGAGRSRLVRQLFTEGLQLAFAGAMAGLLVAYWILDFLIAFSPPGTPRLDEIAVDGRVLVFTLVLAFVTAVLFGLAPALQISRPNLSLALRDGSRGSPGYGGLRLRGSLVVAELALALVLLAGAGLLVKSFALLRRVDPGINPARVLTFNLALPSRDYAERHQVSAFYAQLLERAGQVPGVVAAGAISTLPFGGSGTDVDFRIEGRPLPPPGEAQPVAWYNQVSASYFKAMGIRLLAGRVFDERDHERAPPVVVISETTARQHFPGENPVGRRVGAGGGSDLREIVGVVADVKHFGLDSDPRPTLYLPHLQVPAGRMAVVVRTAGEPLEVVPKLRGIVTSLDRNLAIADIRPMESLISDSIALPRFTLLLFGFFSGVALTLAAVGLYGVMSYSVAQRTHEIGIRMALGARREEVLRMVVAQGVILTSLGLVLGLAGALGITRLASSLLFEVSPTDPLTFALISIVLAAVALFACYLPARRAVKVDPVVALRCE